MIVTPYRRVYTPEADIYTGPETVSFKPGTLYDEWIANDFTVIKGSDGCWHAYGITHPRPPEFISDYDYAGDVHEAEYQLFHCTYKGPLNDLLRTGKFDEKGKVLAPSERSGQRPECWAPCIIRRGEKYHMFYAPTMIHMAVTDDMYHFTIHDEGLFGGSPILRDPYIFQENGLYYMVYVTENLCYRSSEDLIHWGEEQLFQINPFPAGTAQESPCIIKREGIYYLLWCIYDGQNGCYDSRTYVFASDSLFSFTGKAPITILKGHAPEIICENGQDYILSVYYPENGLNIAQIEWE